MQHLPSWEPSHRGTRVRLQRVRDAKFFGGWTVDYDGRQILIDSVQASEMKEGDSFLVQMFGKENKTMYSAVCTSLGLTWACFDVQGTTRPFVVNEDVRLRIHLFGKLTFNGFIYDVDVLDVGPNGVGIIAPLELHKGDWIDLALETPAGRVQMTGKVRYCLATESALCHRVGLQTEISDRVQRGWWKELFLDVA